MDAPAAGSRLTGRGAAAAAFLAYLLLAIWATWPLATSPSRLGTPNMDVFGNVWAMAWVDRQAAREPAQLFDSNMFYPWTRSLGYAESLLPQALLAAPVRRFGGSPLLAYNVVLLLSFALSGLGAYLLAVELSGSRGAGFLAGLGFGFFAYRWHHLVHLQSLSTQWLPLALLCARRAMRVGRARHFMGLGVFSLLQVLSSGYFAMLVSLAVAVTLALEWLRDRRTCRLLVAGAALAVAAGLALPVFLEHRALQARHGFSRGTQEALAWSARPASYLDPGQFNELPHLARLRAWTKDGQPLFPGSWVLLFAGAACFARLRRHEARLAAAWAILGFALSLGPVISIGGASVAGPFELFRLLPGGSLLRTPARLGVLAVLGLDMLAALGWAHFVAGRRRRIGWLAAAAGALAIELHPTEVHGAIREMPRPSPAAGWLARGERGVVLELPWNDPGDCALYLYWSTLHWQPMVNGFGSFDPPGNFGLGLLGNRWPSPYAVRVFRENAIRYVVVHVDRLKEGHRQRLLAGEVLPTGVRLVADLGPDRIYVIEPGNPGALKMEKPSQSEGSSVNPR